MLSSSTSDLIINFRQFIENCNEGNFQEATKTLAFLTLNVLFISSFCYGAIEITVACMLLQIYLNLHLAEDCFKKGDYFEGLCQWLLAGAHMHKALPQLELLNWKREHQPVLTAELKQEKRGFVYLDIPDEYLHSLADLYKDENIELPPYFGKNNAGGHVSAILRTEIAAKNGLTIQELGKKFNFRIVHMTSVKPDGWKGIDKVCFLTLNCPELESMREQYGFTPKINGHDFHITFGIQSKSV